MPLPVRRVSRLFAKAPIRYRLWRIARLNERHGLRLARLFSVGMTDLYVRLISMGVISDPRFF